MKIPALPLKCIMCVLLAFSGTFLACSVFAHQSNQSGDSLGWPFTNPDADHGRITAPTLGMQRPDVMPDNSCSMWDAPDSKRSAVSAGRLQVPPKARDEYSKACGDVRHKKLASAANHLHSAVGQYRPYADAWVLLGEVLESENHVDDALNACSQATYADSNYPPAYLCLADAAGQQGHWDQTLDMANHALAIESQDVYGYFYAAVAQFHLNCLAEAENSALQTISVDHSHRITQVHVLLGQIYAGRNDLPDAAAELKVYLKLSPNAPDAKQVRSKLADLEGQIKK